MTPVLNPEYDYMGRRIRKMVRDGGQVVLTDEKFCYDGWNLLAVINAANNNSTKTFLWGLDLSGSQQGAGGVGGLLSIWQSGDGSHFACYDGNGNVMKLISASSVTATANYEYSPFGDVVLATGTAATVNPFRFSTKYQDDETGLFYYGYRYYIPGTGRWASRDPMEEEGGLNLYVANSNNQISSIDPFGLYDFTGRYPAGGGVVTFQFSLSVDTQGQQTTLTIDYDVGADIGKGAGAAYTYWAGKNDKFKLELGAMVGTLGEHSKGKVTYVWNKCCIKYDGNILDAQAGAYGSADGKLTWTHGDPNRPSKDPTKFQGFEYVFGVSAYVSVGVHLFLHLTYDSCVKPRVLKLRPGIASDTRVKIKSTWWSWDFIWGNPDDVTWFPEVSW